MVPARQMTRVKIVEERAEIVSQGSLVLVSKPCRPLTVELVFQPPAVCKLCALDLYARKDSVENGAEQIACQVPAHDSPAAQP